MIESYQRETDENGNVYRSFTFKARTFASMSIIMAISAVFIILLPANIDWSVDWWWWYKIPLCLVVLAVLAHPWVQVLKAEYTNKWDEETRHEV